MPYVLNHAAWHLLYLIAFNIQLKHEWVKVYREEFGELHEQRQYFIQVLHLSALDQWVIFYLLERSSSSQLTEDLKIVSK